MARELGIGVVGLGHWGTKVARAFARTEQARVVALCDANPPALATDLGASVLLPPEIQRTTAFSDLLENPAVEAVVIATPSPSHGRLAQAALARGKHVFVEKPLALTLEEATEICRCASRSGRCLMVGHILEYHPAITLLRQVIARGSLGRVRFVSTERRGARCPDEAAWWTLAPHDLGLARLFLAEEPREILVREQRLPSGCVSRTARVDFGAGAARIEVAASHVERSRRVVVFGTSALAVFDDLDGVASLRLHATTLGLSDAAVRPLASVLAELPEIGWHSLPYLSREPLAVEAEQFVRAVTQGAPISSDAEAGARVVALLEAGDASFRLGRPVVLPGWSASEGVAAGGCLGA